MRAAMAPVVAVACSMLAAGCRSVAPPSPVPPTSATALPMPQPGRTVDALLTTAANGPRWTPSISATPLPETEVADIDETPDAAGYIASPRSVLRGYDDYVRLEAGPVGAFLIELRLRLTKHDASWLTALAGPASGSTALVSLGRLEDDDSKLGSRTASVVNALATVALSESEPIIQGYFASHADQPLSIDWSDPAELALIDTLDVVITGWKGPAGTSSPASATPAAPAPGTAVWRFAREGDAWRWRSWRWVDGGGYRATLVALERVLAPPGNDIDTFYHIVRPPELWPSPVATVQREEPSPDGQWVAREVVSDLVRIDPRDPESALGYSAVEVVDRLGDVVGRPLAYWQRNGIGGHSPGIVRWRVGRNELIVADYGSGEGCVLHGGGSLWRYEPGDDRVTPLPAGPDAVLDPTDRWLASVDTNAVRIHDIDTAAVVSATFEAGQEFHEAVWAPDSSAVVFTIVDDYRECADERVSHLMRFDRDGSRLTVLTQPGAGSWRVKRWLEDGTLEVVVTGPREESGPGPTRSEWRDARSGATVRAAATTTNP